MKRNRRRKRVGVGGGGGEARGEVVGRGNLRVEKVGHVEPEVMNSIGTS